MADHKIILANRQAMGDVVVLTAFVRDLHKCCPGQFATRVATSFPSSVWVGNPYLSSSKECPAPPESRVIKMHYGDQMRMAARGVQMHFVDAFHHYFNHTVGGQYGVEVELTEPKPDLHLSAAELENRPAIHTKDPYWIMIAGGKSDMTTKWWDKNSYQRVVDLLKTEGIPIVQCGGRNHYHPRLNNVHSLVGKTSVRELMQLIAHAEGVICPITGAMHVAAALDTPAVVIAGSRETPHWEAYPGHEYLHTIGKIHCGERACHACTTSQISKTRCKDFIRPGVEDNTITVARCMHSITPERVVESVMSYSKDTPTPARVTTWHADIPPVDIAYIEKPMGNPRRRPAKRPAPAETRPPQPRKEIPEEMKIVPDNPLTVEAVVALAEGERELLPDRGLGDKVTISTVFYGGGTDECYELPKDKRGKFFRFQDLHMRFLGQLAETVPWERVDSLRVATNDVSDIVLETLTALNKFCPVYVYGPNINRYKYPRLREMWYDEKRPLATEAVISFDDDIRFDNPRWFETLETGVRIGRKKGAVCFGDHYTFRPTRRTMKWYQSRPWWRDKKPQTRGGRRRITVNFTLGGAWAMLSDYIKALNWPDPGLKHCGGDVALGMALWQNEMKFHPVKFVDQLNTPRRGCNEGHPWL